MAEVERTGILRAMDAARAGRGLRTLRGHLDDAASPRRLYLDAALEAYVELPEDAVVLGPDGPLAEALAWFARDAKLPLRTVDRTPEELGFTTDDPFLVFPSGVGDDDCCCCSRPQVRYALRSCRVYPKTSHTIGWCATD